MTKDIFTTDPRAAELRWHVLQAGQRLSVAENEWKRAKYELKAADIELTQYLIALEGGSA